MKKKNNLAEVVFTYVGTDEQFTEFLKSLVHDHLIVDHPHTIPSNGIVDNVDSRCA